MWQALPVSPAVDADIHQRFSGAVKIQRAMAMKEKAPLEDLSALNTRILKEYGYIMGLL